MFKPFGKALDKASEIFDFLRTFFPHRSIAKIKEGGFVGPEIRKFMLNEEFDKMLNTNELEAWKCFKQIFLKFIGSHKAKNYEDIVANLLHTYDVLGCKMSLKVHFLESIQFFFTKVWEMFRINKAKDSIKILLSLKKDLKENVLWGSLQITVVYF